MRRLVEAELAGSRTWNAAASVEHQGLRFEVGKQTLSAAFPADTGLLESAKGDAEVDAHLPLRNVAGADLPGDVVCTVIIVRQHRAVEAVDRVVGDADRIGLAIAGNQADHRAEDLLLGDD